VPDSPQECFDLAVKALNLAERFRVPVMFMMDECVGHMTEKVVIPEAERSRSTRGGTRRRSRASTWPFEAGEDLVPEMAHAGEGYGLFVTGPDHDDRGYPLMNPKQQGNW
jgi:2-oxoglutarate/2-oxoacid ferredoxin oxidoreductase subunit alpha